MLKQAVISLMVALSIGGAMGCQSSDSESPSTSAGLSTEPSAPEVPPTTSPVTIKEATQAAEAWLQMLDAGKCEEAWDRAGKPLKDSTNKAGWCAQTRAIRNAMGPVASRKVAKTEYQNKLGKVMPGDYVTFHFDTAFKATDRGSEEVSIMRDKDGTWRPLGYYVSVKPTPPTPAKH